VKSPLPEADVEDYSWIGKYVDIMVRPNHPGMGWLDMMASDHPGEHAELRQRLESESIKADDPGLDGSWQDWVGLCKPVFADYRNRARFQRDYSRWHRANKGVWKPADVSETC